jgi:Undecaprenyl-phosphate glucose phosphotransferase
MDESQRWSRVPLETIRAAEAATAARDGGGLNPEAEAAAQTLAAPPLSSAAAAMAVGALDAAAGFATVWIALTGLGLSPAEAALPALLASALATGGLALGGCYSPRVLASVSAGAGGAAAAAAASGAVVLQLAGFAAPVVLGVAAAFSATLALLRFVEGGFFAWARASGALERRAVIVGGGPNAERLIRGLRDNPDNDIRIVAMFDDRADDRSPPLVAGIRKLGAISEILDFARIARIDMLIVTLPLSAEKRILSLLRALWVLPVEVRLSAYSADYAFPQDTPLIGLREQPLAAWRRWAKRALDIVAAVAALIVLSPILVAAALAVRLDSPGPIFFRQLRHGFNDQPVRVFKFRSMRAETCDPEARTIVTEGDPRVTRVGRFLRRTSIDELPQLFNVLAGDLSLVGPRPHALIAKSSREELFTEIVDGYSGRHRVPPGITGWAQIHGWRGEVNDPEDLRRRFEHDLYYIENWSLWLDLKILLRTPFCLFDTRRAY